MRMPVNARALLALALEAVLAVSLALPQGPAAQGLSPHLPRPLPLPSSASMTATASPFPVFPNRQYGPRPLRLHIDDEGELRLMFPLIHQISQMDSPARFKVRQAGRREGKTVIDFVSAIAGHGPGWQDGTPMWEGVLQGWDVVWIAKDYNQAKGIWEGEIEPRFRGLEPLVKLNITDRTVKVLGRGTLHIRSGDRKSITGIRGLGKRIKGVICDEAAWWDLFWAWRNVLRPILVDNKGWAIFTSTTNKGTDGGKDTETGNIIVPSYFNRLCQAVIDGAKGRRLEDGWERFYGTAADNPKIAPEEFQALLDEYVPGSLEEAQEVYAKLLTGGAGLAFHEWREDLHVAKYDPPAGWRWFAGLDWGYRKPFAIVIFAVGPDGDILARHEMYGKGQTPYQVGYVFAQKCLGLKGRVEWLACDAAIWGDDRGETIAEDLQKGLTAGAQGQDPIPLISVPKGPGSRPARVLLLHEYLRYETLPAGLVVKGVTIPANTPAPWGGPRLRFHRECKNCIRTIPSLPIDPKDSEDVDTEAEDHCYDAVTYALRARVPLVEREDSGRVPDDVHPGYDIEEGRAIRKPRWITEEQAGRVDAHRLMKEAAAQGRFITGVRVGGARPTQEDE